MATSSSTDPHKLVKWLFLVSKEFPNLDPVTAFHRFIRERKLLGLFFIEDEQRYILRFGWLLKPCSLRPC